jgi:hypothetical protein
MIYLDLDDFCEDNNSLDLLFKIRGQIPKFKVNLFTIVGRCNDSFFKYVKTLDWIDCIPHGFLHHNSRECENWDFKKCCDYLKWVEKLNLTKGFKAPGWQISDGMYAALLKEDYFVADQQYNNMRRPKKLKAYLLDSPDKIHGHIGHSGGYNDNELSIITSTIMKFRDEEFGFIRDVI